jgi:uncharacterized membrane protein YkvA (DUF1232 family)
MQEFDDNLDKEKTFEAEVLEDYENNQDMKKVNGYFKKLRESVTQWAEKKGGNAGKHIAEVILFAPDLFMLLVRLFQDKRISPKSKTMILAGISYFILPIDFLPEAVLGPLGLADDVFIGINIVNMLLNTDKMVVLENWDGNEKIITFMQDISEYAKEALSKNVAGKVLTFLAKFKRF